MGNITLLCNVSQLESGGWARVDIPCDYFRPLHCLLHWRSNFVRLKSRGSSELTNISISISIQRICLDLQLMETYVKCLTFAYGILPSSSAAVRYWSTFDRKILTKAPLPFAHTELLFTSPLIPQCIGVCLSRHP